MLILISPSSVLKQIFLKKKFSQETFFLIIQSLESKFSFKSKPILLVKFQLRIPQWCQAKNLTFPSLIPTTRIAHFLDFWVFFFNFMSFCALIKKCWDIKWKCGITTCSLLDWTVLLFSISWWAITDRFPNRKKIKELWKY